MPVRLDEVAALVELNQAELELALESGQLALWDADLVASHTWVSPNTESLFGLDERIAHWTQERFFDFVHPDDRRRVTAVLAAQRDAATFEFECRIITGKGDVRWIRSCGHRVVAPDGTVVRAFGATVDITARKFAQAAVAGTMPILRFLADLAEALARQTSFSDTLATFVRQVVDSFADGCLIDFENGPSPRRRAYAHRVPDKEAILADITARFPPAAGEDSPVAKAVRTGRTRLCREIDDAWRQATARARGPEYGEALRRLDLRSAIIVPVALGTDLSGAVTYLVTEGGRRFGDADQRLAEELTRRGAAAFERAFLHGRTQEALRARDTLISTSSHELLTPITTMKLLVDSMKRTLAADEDLSRPKVERMLDVTDRAIRRLQRLVDDMLDVSRINAGRLSLHARPMDLSIAVGECVERLHETLDRHLAKIELQLTTPLPGAWDHDRIDQIVTNLVTNVVRYAPQSTLTISTRLVDEGMAEIAVADTGPGIARGDQERIFQKFERALLPGDGTGLGLGLFIVKQIVERHRGQIWVESDLGAGARFVVRLPLA